MKRKTLIGLVGAVVVLFLVAYFASPIFAVRSLIGAARTGDEATLERRVDFPVFRQSLKEELNAQLVAEMRADLGERGGGLGGLGMLLAPSLIGGAVDTLVTPSAVAAMVRSGEAPGAGDVMRNRTAPPHDDGQRVRQSYSYRDLNTFAVRLTRDDKPDAYLDLLMQRRGLFDWKLAGIDLSRKGRS